jgi:tRNA (guanine37-N1)-methyltransferase
MRFDILTLFPEAFTSWKESSILGRALQDKKCEVNLFDIRDFSTNKHRKVDDVPYGGGAGMLMTCQPLFDTIEHVKNLKKDDAPVIFCTPHGETFDQELAEELSDQKKYSRLIFLCGHYEGIDQRVRDTLVDREISLGDFVLTGGELPAQVMVDAIARLTSGVLGKAESHQEESFSAALDRQIEYPHYTRPSKFRGLEVPEILLSGHHAEITKWRRAQCQPPNSKQGS